MVTLTNLFKIIEEKGLTKSQVSKDTGISSGNISDWQNGRSMPTAIKLDVLANYLDVSVDYLLGRTEKPDLKIENIHYSNVINGTNGDNSPMTVPKEKTQDKITDEFMKLFQSLDITDKIAVMNLAVEKSKINKK